MSLRWLRRLVAGLVLVAWTGGIALPAFGVLHVPDLVDFDGGDTLLGIPHPVTQIEPVRPPVGDGHCAICHLQRAARGAALFAVGTAASTELAASKFAAREDAPSAASVHALPSRAPPPPSLT